MPMRCARRLLGAHSCWVCRSSRGAISKRPGNRERGCASTYWDSSALPTTFRRRWHCRRSSRLPCSAHSTPALPSRLRWPNESTESSPTMHDLKRTMHDAMNLIRGGDLRAATQAIQRGLQTQAPAGTPAPANDFIDATFEVVHERADDAVQPGTDAPTVDATNEIRDNRRAPDRGAGDEGEFREHRFACASGALRYKLYVPPGLDPAIPPPLLVMLHGCTQSPDDFARGTRMNTLAHRHGYVVAYPAQSPKNNAGKCWNWFRSGDQQRGRGEPALIAT